MKDIEMKDERIVAQRRRIQSDAYQILVYCLLISVLFQQFFMHVPFSQFAVEFFCLIGIGIYVTIRHLSIGDNMWSTSAHTGKKILINGVVSGAISTFLTVLLAGERNILNLLLFFICFTAAYSILHLMMQNINNKRQKQIDASLKDDETDE